MNRIVFLDIDGPVIVTPHYLINSYASIQRKVMSTNAIGWLNMLLRDTDAKLVTNSMHNYHNTDEDSTLRADLIKHGLAERFFHEDWRTAFPGEVKLSGTTKGRMRGIDEWMEKNGIHDWVAFDDEFFTDDARLIHIDNNDGILQEHYLKAMAIFNVEKPRILMPL